MGSSLCILVLSLLLDITLRFSQSVYRVDENVESATLVLVIDNVLSTNITLKIEEINNNMNSK